MPCRDYDDNNRVVESGPKIDKLTRMLCSLCKSISGNGLGHFIRKNEELQNWWVEHQEQDRRRLIAERKERERKNLKRNALSKLSREEREVLGLLE